MKFCPNALRREIFKDGVCIPEGRLDIIILSWGAREPPGNSASWLELVLMFSLFFFLFLSLPAQQLMHKHSECHWLHCTCCCRSPKPILSLWVLPPSALENLSLLKGIVISEPAWKGCHRNHFKNYGILGDNTINSEIYLAVTILINHNTCPCIKYYKVSIYWWQKLFKNEQLLSMFCLQFSDTILEIKVGKFCVPTLLIFALNWRNNQIAN